ncbi:bidirectional sugar transporter SWEET1a-like [Dioscorea cayenensis subsp. rotundata]|uniref:Bidirectional sugar transporter SWEET n=1 Tax=Dioscorea cayennensis subsp. rotundata TaxID=55577 RepID=A0AB40CK52_DIOCR|nr:bidirectional sugar transporter SWEET1a-like [Dioscorea cayenensis subsp. rotundata]
MQVLHFLFGVLGNAIALFLFLSPTVTFRRIIKKKTTEDFSGVPYNMTLLNCLLSAWYGLPFVSPNNLLVSTINGTGAVIEFVYVTIFLIYAPKKVKSHMMGLLALVVTIFTSVALVSVLAIHGQTRKVFCGSAAVIFSVCMYGSPLAVMSLVIKTKSVEFMPFLLSLLVFLCATFWFIYGLFGHDIFIAIPNGCGSVLGAMQLILYMIYRKNKGSLSKSATTSTQAIAHPCVEIGDKLDSDNNPVNVHQHLHDSFVVEQV